MGIDYTFTLVFGYNIPEDTLRGRFGHVTEEVTATEHRWDPKTGEKLAPVMVVTKPAEMFLRLDDVDYEDLTEFVEALSKKLGCVYAEEGSHWSGGTSFTFGPDIPERDEPFDEGHVTARGGCYLSDLIEAGPEIERLAKAFLELGIDPGQPLVRIATLVF